MPAPAAPPAPAPTRVPPPEARSLHAGPVRCTLADGELRYLYIGQREVVRRIYFCVRFHEKWDTAANEITRCEVESDEAARTFEIRIEARAVTGPVNYGWSARITGASDGSIAYSVHGAALGECTHIRRCGIQLLLGADAVVGQPYVLTRPDRTAVENDFQVRLDPEVLPMQFSTLRYRTREGVEVSADFSGTLCGYEDQRNFNDSSWKFFSAHPHTYPTLARGVATETTVTLRFGSVPAPAAPLPRLGARVGSMTGGARLPRLIESAASTPNALFIALNKNRPAQWTAKLHTWGFTPAVNLHDDDTFMENTAAILDQIRTARVFTNPHGLDIACRIDPVHFESLHPRPARDGRNYGPFAAAWLVAFTKYAAMGAACEISTRLGPGPVDDVRLALAALAGRAVRTITVTAPARAPVEAFGTVDAELRTTLWFANLTDAAVALPVENVTPGDYHVRRSSAARRWADATRLTHGPGDTLALSLEPYEVQALTPIAP